MISLAEIHPGMQHTISYLSHFFSNGQKKTLASIAQEQGISRQAVHKQIQEAIAYLRMYKQGPLVSESKFQQLQKENRQLKAQCEHLKGINKLQRRLILTNTIEIKLLTAFKSAVTKFFPNLKFKRVSPELKKSIIDSLEQFKRLDGTVQEFVNAIGFSAQTLRRWIKKFEAHGINGLADQATRPKNFGNRITLKVKRQLLVLFKNHPKWTAYDYHKLLRFHPSINWYVSLPVIQRLKNLFVERTQAEKDRIRKRWCFAPGTAVWAMDFVSISKAKNGLEKLCLFTISDHRSRFLLNATLHLETSVEMVIRQLEELFIKYGIPSIIKADNGPEFRTDCRESLKALGVYLLNSPNYYGQFCGAHERIHRKIHNAIDDFQSHQNLTFLMGQIQNFVDEYNYTLPSESLGGETPANIFFSGQSYVHSNSEVITPYHKDGELRMKFTDRYGKPARLALPAISLANQATCTV